MFISYHYYITIQENDTGLILACQRNELAIVSTLLEFGANPSVCNKVNYMHIYASRSDCITSALYGHRIIVAHVIAMLLFMFIGT